MKEKEKLKERIMRFYENKKEKTAFISDIAEALDIQPSKLLVAIRELEKEGYLKEGR